MAETLNLSKTVDEVLSGLSEREGDIIRRRYGLVEPAESLQDIADDYNLTRERIRQIQARSLNSISAAIQKNPVVNQLNRTAAKQLGPLALRREASLLQKLKEYYQFNQENNLRASRFFLRQARQFQIYPEDDNFHAYFSQTEKNLNLARHILKRLLFKFLEEPTQVWSESKIYNFVLVEIKKHLNVNPPESEIFGFIRIIKVLGKNPYSQFGLSNHILISPPSLKEKIRLIFEMEGQPLHFKTIHHKLNQFLDFKDDFLSDHWRKDYSVESIHNQMILDPEVVLAGRGIYALKRWGYYNGETIELLKELVSRARRIEKEKLWCEVQKAKMISRTTFEIYIRRRDLFKLNGNEVERV
ncbi:MAG: hypothetical protein M1505_01180 [Patescibacteria group bacterium]|nr:hypothetical protein [Patescibacteria group bacterium]MCL5257829.1 hypothetical protein [Patescibacteria group bacterium]